jgi:hypothetical protein
MAAFRAAMHCMPQARYLFLSDGTKSDCEIDEDDYSHPFHAPTDGLRKYRE